MLLFEMEGTNEETFPFSFGLIIFNVCLFNKSANMVDTSVDMAGNCLSKAMRNHICVKLMEN